MTETTKCVGMQRLLPSQLLQSKRRISDHHLRARSTDSLVDWALTSQHVCRSTSYHISFHFPHSLSFSGVTGDRSLSQSASGEVQVALLWGHYIMLVTEDNKLFTHQVAHITNHVELKRKPRNRWNNKPDTNDGVLWFSKHHVASGVTAKQTSRQPSAALALILQLWASSASTLGFPNFLILNFPVCSHSSL